MLAVSVALRPHLPGIDVFMKRNGIDFTGHTLLSRKYYISTQNALPISRLGAFTLRKGKGRAFCFLVLLIAQLPVKSSAPNFALDLSESDQDDVYLPTKFSSFYIINFHSLFDFCTFYTTTVILYILSQGVKSFPEIAAVCPGEENTLFNSN